MNKQQGTRTQLARTDDVLNHVGGRARREGHRVRHKLGREAARQLVGHRQRLAGACRLLGGGGWHVRPDAHTLLGWRVRITLQRDHIQLQGGWCSLRRTRLAHHQHVVAACQQQAQKVGVAHLAAGCAGWGGVRHLRMLHNRQQGALCQNSRTQVGAEAKCEAGHAGAPCRRWAPRSG